MFTWVQGSVHVGNQDYKMAVLKGPCFQPKKSTLIMMVALSALLMTAGIYGHLAMTGHIANPALAALMGSKQTSLIFLSVASVLTVGTLVMTVWKVVVAYKRAQFNKRFSESNILDSVTFGEHEGLILQRKKGCYEVYHKDKDNASIGITDIIKKGEENVLPNVTQDLIIKGDAEVILNYLIKE